MSESLSDVEADFLDPQLIEDPYPFYARLRERAPVYEIPDTGVYLVSTWQLITEVLKNRGDYSAHLTGILVTGADGSAELFDLTTFGSAVDAIANADEPEHSVHRKLVLPQLTARKVEAMEANVRCWARERVRILVDSGSGDWQASVADPVPVLAMAALVGLPLDDLQQLLNWAFAGGRILAGTTTLEQMAELGAATADMTAYLSRHLDRVLESGAAGAPASILDELAGGVRDGIIDRREAVSILVVLVGAAGESTASLAGSAVHLLARDAVLQQQLREEPALVGNFVEEVVRLESPFKGHYRVVLRDTRLGELLLPAGARLMLLWAAANRDPEAFERPDELDLHRQMPRDHLGFGQGIHFCVGARLARLEARVMVEELLACTSSFVLDTAAPGHIPSVFVRRLTALPLRYC